MESANLEHDFAGCGEHQSGQRFLDSSDPRLIRHAAACETAGGSTHLPPAGKDEKLSREFEGGALIGREAPVPSSLDEIQIKRDRPTGWKRNCGRFTARGPSLDDAQRTRYCKVGCKCWDCSGCGPRRAKMYRIRIAQIAEKYKLNILLTLTLDPKRLLGKESTRNINRVFADFRVYLKRKLGYTPTYIRILEYQKNGNAHLHVLLNCCLPQDWASEAWSALGGGPIVDIRYRDIQRISRYLSKYLTKQMLLCAPKRARRVTTSRNIRLLEKRARPGWTLVRVPILRLFDVYRALVVRTQAEEGYLLAFETNEKRTGFSP